jgi:hypothetical protein
MTELLQFVIVQSHKVSLVIARSVSLSLLVIARSVSDEAIWFSPPEDEIRLWRKERDCFANARND